MASNIDWKMEPNLGSLVKNMSTLTKDVRFIKRSASKGKMQKFIIMIVECLSVLCYKEGDIIYYKDNSVTYTKYMATKQHSGKKIKLMKIITNILKAIVEQEKII